MAPNTFLTMAESVWGSYETIKCRGLVGRTAMSKEGEWPVPCWPCLPSPAALPGKGQQGWAEGPCVGAAATAVVMGPTGFLVGTIVASPVVAIASALVVDLALALVLLRACG